MAVGLYRLLVILSAVIVALYIAWNLATMKAPSVREEPSPSLTPAGSQSTAQGPEEQDDPTVPARERRKDVYNFVLLGRDVNSGNTDTIIVVSYDIPNQKVGMISIPRDTAVERSWNSYPKINFAYAGAGAETLKEEIQYTFGIPIDYYIHVNVKGFIALVDELGGVDVDIPVNMNYDDPTPGQELHIHYNKGYQHLTGQQAMEVARYRHDNDPTVNASYTDVGRAQMQRQILTALAKKALSWNSLTKVQSFLDIFQTYVTTDLTAGDMLYFAKHAMNMDLSTGLSQGVLEGSGEGVYKGKPYCFVFEAETILPVLNELVNPYDQPLTAEDLHLPKSER